MLYNLLEFLEQLAQRRSDILFRLTTALSCQCSNMNNNCPVHNRFLQHASSASHFEGSFCQCSASSQVSRFFLASCISLDDSFRLNSDSLFSSWLALRTLSTPSNSLTYLHHPPLLTGRTPAHHPLLPPWIAPGNAPFVRNRSIVDRSKKGTD